jgi:very-short-patch-repair endonuclease
MKTISDIFFVGLAIIVGVLFFTYIINTQERLDEYIAAHGCKQTTFVLDDDGNQIPVYTCKDGRTMSQHQILSEM